MNIVVAGAGAGKTTSMAQKVIERYNKITNKEDKMIFVVSYTNAAKNNIEKEIKARIGSVPKQIKVSTIHSFLLHQIIYPYHHFVYEQHFTSSSSSRLPSSNGYKNQRKKELRSINIVHVEDATRVAKNVVYGKSDDRKKNRVKRKRILKLLTSYIDSIYVDEAQDMDKYFSQVLIALDEEDIKIDLIGDPKQDLRNNGVFTKLIEERDEVNYIGLTHRCPKKHVNLSNQYVREKERQYSNKPNGSIHYLLESETDIDHEITNNYDLVYIYQKSGQFVTSKKQELITNTNLFLELKIFIEKYVDIGKEHIEPYAYLLLKRIISRRKRGISPQKLTNHLLSKYFKYTDKNYARIITAIKALDDGDSNNENVLVDSIDKIKGLEGDKCLFIITKAIAPYLFKEKRERNKMLNYLYVGLTRSKNELNLLIASDVENNYGIDYLEDKLKQLGIEKKNLPKC